MTCPECGMEMIPSPLDPTFLIHTESTDCAPQPWPRVPTEDCFGITVIKADHDEVEEGRRERRDFYRNRDY